MKDLRFTVTHILALPTLAACFVLSCTANAQTGSDTTTPVKHVVVIFQENVSFDHYFATYPTAANTSKDEPAFVAASNTPTVNGLSGPLLLANPNSTQPFRLSRAQAVTCDQNHSYANEQKAMNFGLMNRFVESVGSSSTACDLYKYGKTIVMGYFDGNTVTAMWNYAQNYAMSDNSFGTAYGPSTPGALNLISGQTHGATVVSGPTAGLIASNSVIGDPEPAYDDCSATGKTYVSMNGKNVGDLLNAKGQTWGFFQGGFRPTSRRPDGIAICAATHATIAGASTADYVPHHQPFQYYKSTANPHHLAPTATTMIGQTDQANHQYDIDDFFTALKAGVMPSVSYLKAPGYENGHAGNSNPIDEQRFLVETINTIQKSPFWKSTAIFIAYDDSDGWYDHVMPPLVSRSNTTDDALSATSACGTAKAGEYQGRCGYGPRLPLLAISPFSRVNFVDHATTDQASILRFIEDNWQLGRIGDQSFDAIAGSLANLFDFAGSGPAGTLQLEPATGLVVVPPPPVAPAKPVLPTAVAGPKNLSTVQKQIQLDGTGSTSADGKPLAFAWQVATGSLQVSMQGANSSAPAVQFAGYGAYTFQLTVTDSSGNIGNDTVTIFYTGR